MDGRVVIGIAPKGSGPTGDFTPFISYHCQVGPLITHPVRFNYIIVRNQNNQEVSGAFRAQDIPTAVNTANRLLRQVGVQYELDQTNDVYLPEATLAQATNVAQSRRQVQLEGMTIAPGLPVTFINGQVHQEHTILSVLDDGTARVGEDLTRDWPKGTRVVTRIQARRTAPGIWEIRGLPEIFCVDTTVVQGRFCLILNGRPDGVNYALVKNQLRSGFDGVTPRALAYSSTRPVNSVAGATGKDQVGTDENGVSYRMKTLGQQAIYGNDVTAGILAFDSYWQGNNLVPSVGIGNPGRFGTITVHEVGHNGRLKHRHSNADGDSLVMLGEIPLVQTVAATGDDEQNVMWYTARLGAIDLDLLQSEVFRGMFRR